MSNKEAFMWYAKRRLKEKANRTKKLNGEASITQIEGFERCSRYRWRAGQR